MQPKQIYSSFIKANKIRIAFAILIALIHSVLILLIPVSIGKYYELMFGLEAKRAKIFYFFPTIFFEEVPNFLIFFSVLIVLSFLFGYWQRYNFAILSEMLVYQLRNRLFKAQMNIDMSIYNQKGIGKYLLRYSGDLKGIQNYFIKGILMFSSDLFLLLLVTLWLALTAPTFLITTAITTPLLVIGLKQLNKQVYRTSNDQRNNRSQLVSFVNQRLVNITTIKAFNRTTIEEKKFEKKSKELFLHGKEFHRYSALINALIPSLIYLVLALVLTVLYWQRESFYAHSGVVLSSILLLITTMPVFRRLLMVTKVWKIGKISTQKLVKVLNEIKDEEKKLPDLYLAEGKIEFRNVSFEYSGQPLSLKEINWLFLPNALHHISGSLGSGKSTCCKLLAGLYRPTSGEILIDEQGLNQHNLRSIRKQMSFISLEFPLIGKTVFEAISYSRKEKNKVKAEEMLQKIQFNLPLKQHLALDDKLGEFGRNLSVGQLKVLQICRALLTDKKIMVLDEPFEGLDIHSKRLFTELLNEIKIEKTILLFSRSLPKALEPDFEHSLDQLRQGKMIRLKTKRNEVGVNKEIEDRKVSDL